MDLVEHEIEAAQPRQRTARPRLVRSFPLGQRLVQCPQDAVVGLADVGQQLGGPPRPVLGREQGDQGGKRGRPEITQRHMGVLAADRPSNASSRAT
ncbi:hypothetical protein [Micromonospora tulbaghiae]|uniref:hypothetical protein n=1 Tax=Micromonospora tulbaghiae TaxID=479978 RepID=UPI001FD0A1CD|nr:hypothetical protein [Micromonospora tulbaghiae]